MLFIHVPKFKSYIYHMSRYQSLSGSLCYSDVLSAQCEASRFKESLLIQVFDNMWLYCSFSDI